MSNRKKAMTRRDNLGRKGMEDWLRIPDVRYQIYVSHDL